MTETTPSPSPAPGFFGMIRGVLARPRPTFAALRASHSRSWLWMALLGLILVTLPVVVSGPIAAAQTRAELREQFENQPDLVGGSFDPEQAASIATSPVLTTVVPAVLAFFGRALGWLIWSGALYLLASMVGGRSSFAQMLQVVIWAWLPYGLRSILQTVYISSTQTVIANPGLSGFAPSPAAAGEIVMPSAGTAVLQTFLSQIDFFLFWNLALLAIGIAAVTRLSGRKAAGLVLIVWTTFIAVRLIAAAVTTSLAGGFMG